MAGVQLGNACWELFCLEHMIGADGSNVGESVNSAQVVDVTGMKGYDESGLHTFFSTSSQNAIVPRNLMVDLEPTVVDEIRTGPYRNLFNPDRIINGIEDAANNFARGRHSSGRQIMPIVRQHLRLEVEKTDCLASFMHLHSYGGGTGAGMGSIVMEHLKTAYSKTDTLEICVYPASRYSSATVEPYNATLSVNASLMDSEMALVFDNECLYKIAERNLSVYRPSFSSLNRLISQIYSSVTSSIRFASSVDNNISHMLTNTVPYPRIHFMASSYSPLCNPERGNHMALTVREITDGVFEEDSFMVDVDRSQGKYMSCCLHYRGLVSPQMIQQAILHVKQRPVNHLQFVDWCPTGFKTGLTHNPPVIQPTGELTQSVRSCTLVCNHSAISQCWERLLHQFDLLYNKRAFVHWYVGEGMEEGEFQEAADNVQSLLMDYEEAIAGDDDNRKYHSQPPSHSHSRSQPQSHSRSQSRSQQKSKSGNASQRSQPLSQNRSTHQSQGASPTRSQPLSQGQPSNRSKGKSSERSQQSFDSNEENDEPIVSEVGYALRQFSSSHPNIPITKSASSKGTEPTDPLINDAVSVTHTRDDPHTRGSSTRGGSYKPGIMSMNSRTSEIQLTQQEDYQDVDELIELEKDTALALSKRSVTSTTLAEDNEDDPEAPFLPNTSSSAAAAAAAESVDQEQRQIVGHYDENYS